MLVFVLKFSNGKHILHRLELEKGTKGFNFSTSDFDCHRYKKVKISKKFSLLWENGMKIANLDYVIYYNTSNIFQADFRFGFGKFYFIMVARSAKLHEILQSLKTSKNCTQAFK